MSTIDHAPHLDMDQRSAIAARVTEVLEAAGYRGTRARGDIVGVRRTLARGSQDIGYIRILADGARGYRGLTRAQAGTRELVEADEQLGVLTTELLATATAQALRIQQAAAEQPPPATRRPATEQELAEAAEDRRLYLAAGRSGE